MARDLRKRSILSVRQPSRPWTAVVTTTPRRLSFNLGVWFCIVSQEICVTGGLQREDIVIFYFCFFFLVVFPYIFVPFLCLFVVLGPVFSINLRSLSKLLGLLLLNACPAFYFLGRGLRKKYDSLHARCLGLQETYALRAGLGDLWEKFVAWDEPLAFRG